MKGRIVTLMCAVALVCCVSCSNDLPGNSTMEDEDITISAAFAVEGVTTKANAGEEDATEQEKTINSKMILAFKNDVCIGFSKDADTIKAKTGTIKLVGIANAEDALVNDLEQHYAGMAYSVLAAKTTNQKLEASTLIKIGEVEKNFTTPGEQAGKTTITVSQIPARVKVSVTAEGNNTFEIASYNISGIATSSVLMPGIVEQKSVMGGLSLDKGTSLFYTYPKVTNGAPIEIRIKGILKKEGEAAGADKTYLLRLDPVDNSADSKTNGIVGGYAYDVTGNIKETGVLEISLKVVPMGKVEVNGEFGGPNSNGSDRPITNNY